MNVDSKTPDPGKPRLNFNSYKKLAGVAGLVVSLDQISKAAIYKTLPLYQSISIIPGFFSITHIRNPGAAFGFMAHHSSSLRSIIFLVVSAVALGLILYFYKNTPKTHPLLATGFALIFGGALGNMIDRIRFGTVVDFLDFYIRDLHWPAFNVADSAISVGVAIFLFHLVFKKLPE